jgi:ComF family protein
VAFEWARSAVTAQDTVLEAIHLYKYKRALCLEPFLASLLVRAAAPRLVWTDWDAMVPVPLFPARQRDREFNQAERLARHLSRATGIPVQSGWVKRIEPTKSQTRLSREERKENMRGAFACRPGADLSGARLLMVDDVFTTGSTTNACATELRRSGATRVCVWTLARGI